MTSWKKEEIEIAGGTKVLAQMPVIVSASRSTDIPAFYSDWFMERLKAGYVKWFNPFNGVPLYVGFKKMRCIVFWSKNPRPMLAHLDALDAICPNYYFQFTLNDYDAEHIEPRVPPLDERVETFKQLSERVGKDRVVWRFDPLILTDKLSVSDILAKIERLGDQVAQYTSRLVFSFIDINAYKKVGGNLRNGGVNAREFTPDEMCTVAQRIGYADAVYVFDAWCRKVTQTFCPRFHSPRRFAILVSAMLRQSFTDFIFATNTDGSGKAASYVRALDMLGPILAKQYPKPIVGGSVWHGFSLADIHAVLTRVSWGHRMLIIDKCQSQPEKTLFYVRRTIQNGWGRDVLRRRRNAIRRDSVKVEERQGGEMTGYPYSAPCSYSLICHQKFREQLTVGFK